MLYLFAVFCPPLGILLTGRALSAILNGCVFAFGLLMVVLTGGILTIPIWIFCAVHAVAVVSESKADRRMDRLASQIRRN